MMKSTRLRKRLLCLLLPAMLAGTVLWAQPPNRLALTVQQEQLSHKAGSYQLFEPVGQRDAAIDREIRNVVYLKLNKQMLNALRTTHSQLVSFSMPFSDGAKTLVLSQYNILDDSFKVYERGSDGRKRAVKMQPGSFYRGIIEGNQHSLAAFTFSEGEVAAVYSTPEDGNYNLVLNYNNPGADRDNYLLFKEKDIIGARPAGCAITEAMDAATGEIPGTVARGTYSSCHRLRVSMHADYKLYQLRGSSVTSAATYLTNLFHVISALYANEGIIAVMSEAVVNSAPDGYTYGSSGEVLRHFGEVVQSDFDGDLAQLISGYKQNGFPPLGGLAWLNMVCQSPSLRSGGVWVGPFSMCDNNVLDNIPQLPIYSWDVSATTHELGHNIGSPHTQSCSWQGGPIDNCVAPEDGGCDPGPAPDASGGTIMSYCHLTRFGINLAFGFGPLPGNLIRQNIANRSCLGNYQPAQTLTTAQKVRVANRQCSDGSWTSYFFDNNTATEADDELLLMINSGGKDIGNVDMAGFRVSMTTTADYGTNKGRTITAPYVTGDWKEANRTWEVGLPTGSLAGTAARIRFPFTGQDLSDIKGSLPGISQLNQLSVLTFNDADAAANPGTAPASSVQYYTNAASADARHWSLGSTDNYYYAEFASSHGIFGGSIGFKTVPERSSLEVYPNPATSWLNINVPAGTSSSGYAIAISDQLGRVILKKEYDATSGGNIQLNVASLSSGVYNIRYVCDGTTFNARFVKRK